MSLTSGKGPLSGRPAGRFTAPMPAAVAYLEPFRRRVRALVGGRTAVDSERVLLVHRPGRPPTYAFPADDVEGLSSEAEPDTPGYVTVPWDAADAWFEEDEEVFGHPRNPYHRVDCLRSARRLQVEAAGTVLVDTAETLAVYETALEPRLYVHPRQVRTGLLEESTTRRTARTRARRPTGRRASVINSWRTSRGATRILCPSPPRWPAPELRRRRASRSSTTFPPPADCTGGRIGRTLR